MVMGLLKVGERHNQRILETSGGHPGSPQLGKVIPVTTLEFAGCRI